MARTRVANITMSSYHNPQIHPPHWPFLDIIRWGAAWLVMLGHVRYLYFESLDQVDGPSVATKAFYFFTGLQNEGVVMFFVVSGFLVGGSIWAAFDENRFDGVRYLVNRIVRIFLVFYPALLLALLILFIGKNHLSDTRVFAQLPGQSTSLNMAICHLACLQGTICSVIVSNSPLWSLSYEWLLYIMAPFFFMLYYLPIGMIWRLAGLFLFLSTFYSVLPKHILWFWFGYWLSGVIAWRILIKGGTGKFLGVAGLVLVGLACILSRAHLIPVLSSNLTLVLGLTTAIASRTIISWSPAPIQIGYLASFSYSLYVIHMPVATLIAGLMEWAGWSSSLSQPGFSAYAVFCFTIVVVVAFAALFARLTEYHTARLRRTILYFYRRQ